MRNHHSSLSDLCTWLLLGGALLTIFFILGSWLWSAAMPESNVRAILSEGGIRWFFGTFVVNLASPLLVWIILADYALGTCRNSGLWAALTNMWHHATDRRQRSGLRSAVFLLIIEVIVIGLLTLPEHAILLSVTGQLFPSSFSLSLVPIITFMLLTASISYGLFSGIFHDYRDVIRGIIHGGSNLKIILAIYVVWMEFACMIFYIFNL